MRPSSISLVNLLLTTHEWCYADDELWALSGTSGPSKSILKPQEKPCTKYSASWYPSSNLLRVSTLTGVGSCWGVCVGGTVVELPGLCFGASIVPGVPWVLLATLEASMVIGTLVPLAPCAPGVEVKAVPPRDWGRFLFVVPKGHTLSPHPTVGFSFEVRAMSNGYTHAPAGTEHHRNSSPQRPYSEAPHPWWPGLGWHRRGAPEYHPDVSGCKPP